jgi:hypothetical protein
VSATEVIEEIKKLPPADEDRVLRFLVRRHLARAEGLGTSVNYATDLEANAAADFVFREHAELLRRLAQ